MKNVKIHISGNSNRLIIKDRINWSESGRIRIEDDSNSILIGEKGKFIGCFLHGVIKILL